MHGPEKLELLQHIIKWKEKENFDNTIWQVFFLQKKKKHHTSLTLYAIFHWHNQSYDSTNDFCTSENKYYDFCTDCNGL